MNWFTKSYIILFSLFYSIFEFYRIGTNLEYSDRVANMAFRRHTRQCLRTSSDRFAGSGILCDIGTRSRSSCRCTRARRCTGSRTRWRCTNFRLNNLRNHSVEIKIKIFSSKITHQFLCFFHSRIESYIFFLSPTLPNFVLLLTNFLFCILAQHLHTFSTLK